MSVDIEMSEPQMELDWLHLPTELWLHVFSFLPKHTFPRKDISLVCSYMWVNLTSLFLNISQKHQKYKTPKDKNASGLATTAISEWSLNWSSTRRTGFFEEFVLI